MLSESDKSWIKCLESQSQCSAADLKVHQGINDSKYKGMMKRLVFSTLQIQWKVIFFILRLRKKRYSSQRATGKLSILGYDVLHLFVISKLDTLNGNLSSKSLIFVKNIFFHVSQIHMPVLDQLDKKS